MKIMGVNQTKKQVIADSEYWHRFGSAFGWRLHGFTFRSHASFFTNERSDRLLEITGTERDTILAKLEGSDGK